jgi:hypothetical protein
LRMMLSDDEELDLAAASAEDEATN